MKHTKFDPDGYAAIVAMVEKTETFVSWIIRRDMSDFLEQYGEKGQPRLPLEIVRWKGGVGRVSKREILDAEQ